MDGFLQKIESSLEQLPKELERFRISMKKISEWENQDEFFNKDYQNIKRTIENSLSRLFSEEKSKIRNSGLEDELGPEVYWTLIRIQPDHYLNSKIKKLSQIENQHLQKIINDLYVPTNELLQRVYKLKESAKSGRRNVKNTSDRPSEKYSHKTARHADIEMVRDLYLKIMCEWKPVQIEQYTKYFSSIVERYKDLLALPNSTDKHKRVKSFESNHRRFFKNNEVVSDIEQVIIDLSKEEVESLQTHFINKNINKVSSIITKKGNLKNISLLSIKVDKLAIYGEIKFIFDDETFFTLVSRAVIVQENFNKPFLRYPSTFHNIKDKDAIFHKTQSQSWMNEDFCDKK